MLYFKSIAEAETVFKALSTPMRLRIMEMIYKDENMSMNDLAEALGLTNGAISMHVGKLEEAGLIKIRTTSGKRGTMKIVRPRYNRLMIDFAPEEDDIFELRRTLPNIALAGGMTTELLGGGTKAECLDYAKKLVDELGRDGGFVMGQKKMISYRNDAKSENVLAVQEFCRECK